MNNTGNNRSTAWQSISRLIGKAKRHLQNLVDAASRRVKEGGNLSFAVRGEMPRPQVVAVLHAPLKCARRAFTLIEVNLAVLVMAGGILSVVVLYSLGFRETRQSREDIASAALADAVLSPLVAALSSDTLTWQQFNSIENVPANGWGSYVNQSTGETKVSQNAATVFDAVMGKIGSSGVSGGYPSGAVGDLIAGMVVCHEQDSGLVKIGFRAAKKESALLSSPLYYTEVRFQGVQENEGGN